MNQWPQKKLGEVASIIRGVSFDKEEASDKPQYGYLPILRAGNIGDVLDTDHDLMWVSETRISEEQFLRPGDVAICMSSGSAQVVGKSAQLDKEWRGSVGAFCAIVRFKAMDSCFGALYLKSSGFFAWRDGQAKGANIQNLRKTELEHLRIPVPPPAEQERIVRILDEADQLRRLRDEADRRTATFIPSLFQEMFGDPGTNPMSFRREKLGNMIKVKSGNFLPANAMDQNGTHPVYGGNGISGYHSSYMFETPVIVIGRVGIYCGAVHYTEPKSWVTDNALYVAEKTEDLEDAYLVSALRYANLNQYSGRAAQPLISGSRIYPVEILVPPLSLQQEYVRQAMEAHALEMEQAVSRQRLEDMFQSLLHRAFQGEL